VGRGKKKQSRRQDYQKQARPQKAGQATVAPKEARTGAATPSALDNVDIPWTAERPQPVRRAFGVFKVGKINFIGNQRLFLMFSGTLIALSLLSLLVRGLNYSIDFTGGNAYTFQFKQAVQESEIRSVLGERSIAGSVIRVDRANPDQALVRTPYLDTAAETALMEALVARFGEIDATAGEAVSPTIGGELLRNALIGTLLACLSILIYVAVRFEYRFASAGVLALVHDSLITVGMFSLLHLEVGSSFVAAILTIIGYSINDTIVVFDRIRDNLKRRGKEGLDALANRSINETFVRSVNTSMTAFLAITAIYAFGGATTRNFALALMIGIFVGTYSSICVATPIWLWWRKRDERVLSGGDGKGKVALRARG
jgi:preprotein translocase subunit SecF